MFCKLPHVWKLLVSVMLLHVTLSYHQAIGDQHHGSDSVQFSGRYLVKRSASQIEDSQPHYLHLNSSKEVGESFLVDGIRRIRAASTKPLKWYVDLLIIVEYNGKQDYSFVRRRVTKEYEKMIKYYNKVQVPKIEFRLVAIEIVGTAELALRFNGRLYVDVGASNEVLFRTMKERKVPHYDVGLLVTRTQTTHVELALGATLEGSACYNGYNIATVERQRGAWSYTGAHELGHSMNLTHDGLEDSCDNTKYIMTNGKRRKLPTEWSACSLAKLRRMAESEAFPCFLE